MADEKHVAILKQGVDVWNKWREENPEVVPDLSGIELNKAELPKANLKKVLFFKIVLGEQIVRPQMRGANLREADLSEADLRWADLGSADLNRAILRKTNLYMANLGLSHLSHTQMAGADLSSADLHAAYFMNSDLSGVNLSKANIAYTNFTGANLQEVNLQETDIYQTQLVRANLSRADLRGASFPSTSLNQADLRWAQLDGADFSQSSLGATILAELDLRGAKGLEEARHDSPSVLDFSTIYKSQGQIPEIFLRQAGVPNEMIVLIQSMAGKFVLTRNYLAFSFSNHEFVEKLFTDLNAAGVSCWRFGRDSQHAWTREMFGAIEEKLRLWDRLIAVCSEDAFQHKPMHDEIELALNLEIEKGSGDVLFPVCLDDVSLKAWEEHNRGDQAQQKIYDFRHWQEPDAYQQAFQELLEDLKATGDEAAGVGERA